MYRQHHIACLCAYGDCRILGLRGSPSIGDHGFQLLTSPVEQVRFENF